MGLLRRIRNWWRGERYEPPARRGQHAPCDTCGQVCSKLTDGLCDWCHRFFGAHK